MSGADAQPPRVIVSLTAIRSRLGLLPGVLRSLRAQSTPADRICLNLSREPYLLDEGVSPDDLPAELTDAAERGEVEVHFVENTGPYRKLLPTLDRHHGEDCLIVTADDDVLYPREWIGGLVEAYRAHGCAAAYRSRAIVHRGGGLLPYRKWPLLVPGTPADHGDIAPEHHRLFTLPTGRGGILYHPKFFTRPELMPVLMALAPRQDDLAFKIALLVAGVPTVVVGHAGRGVAGAGATGESLYDGNRTANDAVAAALFAEIEARGLFRWSDYLRASA